MINPIQANRQILFLFSTFLLLIFFILECSHKTTQNIEIKLFSMNRRVVHICRTGLIFLEHACKRVRVMHCCKTAVTFTIFNISFSKLRYRYILMLPSIWYCQISMESRACMMHVNKGKQLKLL